MTRDVVRGRKRVFVSNCTHMRGGEREEAWMCVRKREVAVHYFCRIKKRAGFLHNKKWTKFCFKLDLAHNEKQTEKKFSRVKVFRQKV